MRLLAVSRGGKCLSNIYVNNKMPLLWECGAGHRWKAAPGSVKSGDWCQACAGLGKPSMSDIRRLAKERGGKCLSENYVNSQTHLRWECVVGHQWEATWNHTSKGHWCPECSAGLGERVCREFFSQLLGASFPKARPKWLVNRAGNQMELDGYCAPLGIAFEHQGEQHYSTKVHFLYEKKFDLSRRQEDDALKSQLCTQRGITLVLVPEIPRLLPLDQVRAFIKEQLLAKRIALPEDIDTREVDTNKAYRTVESRERLKRLRRISRERGGRLLSTSWVNSKTKLLWQCSQGHKWEATGGGIERGRWCPFCAGYGKTIQDMQKIAAQNGGKCLSPAYEGNKTRLLWECSKGHRWEATPNHIERGQWCLFCAGKARGTLQGMQEIAESRGGKCLSNEYVNSSTHLLWQCKEGHQWKAKPNNIKSGTWCPVCGHRRAWPVARELENQGGRIDSG